MRQLGRSYSLIVIFHHEEGRSSISEADEVVKGLNYPTFTLFVKHLRCLMLQKSITSLLPYLRANRILCLLRFLKKFRHFFEARIWLLLFLLCLFYVVEKHSVSLVINLLGRSLRFTLDMPSEGINPINFLFGHSNQTNYYITVDKIDKW